MVYGTYTRNVPEQIPKTYNRKIYCVRAIIHIRTSIQIYFVRVRPKELSAQGQSPTFYVSVQVKHNCIQTKALTYMLGYLQGLGEYNFFCGCSLWCHTELCTRFLVSQRMACRQRRNGLSQKRPSETEFFGKVSATPTKC